MGLSKKDLEATNKGETVPLGDYPPEKPMPFRSNDELLETARLMFLSRNKSRNESNDIKDNQKKSAEISNSWKKYWHSSFALTGIDVPLWSILKEHNLSKLEIEIVILLLLDRLALFESEINSCNHVIKYLDFSEHTMIQAFRCLSENGKLYQAGLIFYEDPDDDLRDRDLLIDPSLVEMILSGSHKGNSGWPVKTEQELFRRMFSLTGAFSKKQDAMDSVENELYNGHKNLYKAKRILSRLNRGFVETIENHPGWKLEKLLKEGGFLYSTDGDILLILIGKELGHLPADNELFTGIGLARAISDDVSDVQKSLSKLREKARLGKSGLIQPCGGGETLISDDPQELAKVEFEITQKCLEQLNLTKLVVKKRSDDSNVREAKVRLEQLVLSGKVQDALEMAIVQSRNADVMMKKWGLGEIFQYGRCVTLLFSGPPGTGKTACAEALAHELDRPILVADYSKIQNCFVGGTEKNIVRVFRQARANGALLFWDEADAMFYDRDSASHNWEVRDVNVILQELENFEGVCILASNRKVTLDKALERRISMKLEFERPERNMRRDIWGKLLPSKLPLHQNVDLGRLAEASLSGGEIKNVILNAARIALCRGRRSKVRMQDFEKAIDMEKVGLWSGNNEQKIGFKKTC